MDSLDVYNLLITSSIEIFSMVISLNSSIKSLEGYLERKMFENI